jgi:hypothetical protein
MKSECYLDARTASQTTLELEKSTADLVLHRRSALVMVDRGSTGTMGTSSSRTAAEHASARLSGSGSGGGSGCGVIVSTGWGTSARAEYGATGGRLMVSSCKRHVGWFCLCDR